MAHSVKVVFSSGRAGIAQAGDVKSVSSGYARNYLYPRKLAFRRMTRCSAVGDERQGTLAKAAGCGRPRRACRSD